MPSENLPDAEVDVLSVLHHAEEATAREIRETLEANRPMTHGAVCTLLKRLEERGLVERRKGDVGKAFIYRVRSRARGVFGRMTRDLVDRVFDGDNVALVSSLYERRVPSEKEIDELQELLDDLKKKSRGRRRNR